jgi:hypothetical protein
MVAEIELANIDSDATEEHWGFVGGGILARHLARA